MPSQTFGIRFTKNTSVLSPKEFLQLFFFGQSILDPATGEPMRDDTFMSYIKQAQDELENDLNMLFFRQRVDEEQDFMRSDFQRFGSISTQYPIEKVLDLQGIFNNPLTPTIKIPIEWISLKMVNKPEMRKRQINLVPPNGLGFQINWTLFFTSYYRSVPNFFRIQYVSGFSVMPQNVINLVGLIALRAALEVFNNLGFTAGLAAFSLSFDGFSRSVSTTNSSTSGVFGATQKNLEKLIPQQMELLRKQYGVSASVFFV